MEHTEGECECRVIPNEKAGVDIVYCPLHKAAPRMACLLERLIDDGWSASISDEAEEILFSIEEGK